MRWILALSVMVTTTATADIYQWFDGDGDGSYWLSSSTVEPYADLSTQVLWWADLPNANLHHSNLSFTNVMFADLSGSNLSASNMLYVNLYGANLFEVDLSFAILSGANMRTSNIGGANLFYADITNADLTDMENWEDAFWIAARYNDNTIFPVGMNPENYAMFYMEIPAPTSIALLSLGYFIPRCTKRL